MSSSFSQSPSLQRRSRTAQQLVESESKDGFNSGVDVQKLCQLLSAF